jgi:hypothetical protein
LNSEFMVRNAKALAAKLTGQEAEKPANDAERIQQAFQLVYGRPANERELTLGLAFLNAPEPQGQGRAPTLTRWEQYAQVLLGANEFLYVD